MPVIIDSFFLDSCLQSFYDSRFSHFCSSENTSFLPVTYEIIDSDFIQPISETTLNISSFTEVNGYLLNLLGNRCPKPSYYPLPDKIIDSAFSSYTGFIASFYKDGQLENFGYANTGNLNIRFIKLAQGKESGYCKYMLEYSGSDVFCYEIYKNGECIESPFIWGDEDIIRKMEFFTWIENAIHQIIYSGFLFRRKYL